jgi:hypothetical protein
VGATEVTVSEDSKEVTSLREVPRDPVCCEQPMKKMIVGVVSGNPRYQFACLKCGEQKRGPELNSKQMTQPNKETAHA